MKSGKGLLIVLIALLLYTSCSKKEVNTTQQVSDITQYYIAGKYTEPTDDALSIPYAILIQPNGKAFYIDAYFGRVNGTYTYANGHFIVNLQGELNATFDYTISGTNITDCEPDGLPIVSYYLEKIPSENVFASYYTGTLYYNTGSTAGYLVFSDNTFDFSSSKTISDGIPFTVFNNGVATAGNGSIFIVCYNNNLEYDYADKPFQGGDAYEYGSFTQ